MRSRSSAALGAAIVLSLGTAAQADAGSEYRRSRVLPPVAGTLHMRPGEFGRARAIGSSRSVAVPETVRVVRGGLYPRETDYQALSPAERWATGGTGVSGLIGNTGNPYAGEAEWGTADSATTGVGLAPRYGWQQRGLLTAVDSPLASLGGSPVGAAAGLAGTGLAGVGVGMAGAGLVDAGYAGAGLGGGYDGAGYGAPPSVPFYGSGTPYSLSYYSSGSSAGPDGSPGGLGTYRSGSYGYGPRVIHAGAYGRYGAVGGGYRQGCTCGPRVVHLRRHHRYAEGS